LALAIQYALIYVNIDMGRWIGSISRNNNNFT